MGKIVQNGTKFGVIVARMKQIPGIVAIVWHKFWCWVVWNLIPRSIAFSDFWNNALLDDKSPIVDSPLEIATLLARATSDIRITYFIA